MSDDKVEGAEEVLSREDYPGLYAALGTTCADDAPFHIPDLRDRVDEEESE